MLQYNHSRYGRRVSHFRGMVHGKILPTPASAEALLAVIEAAKAGADGSQSRRLLALKMAAWCGNSPRALQTSC